MVKFFKDNIKYILQSIVVLLSVLLSFYIDSIRVNNQNAKYKNELVKDLQSIIENERIQIKNIKDLQVRCRNAADELIYDITQNSFKLSEREIAEKLLLLTERGSVSFFSQSSLYDELKNTGSTRLIKSDNFRYALSNTYNNLNQRNLAVSRIIDDYFFRALARINKKIIIFSKEEKSSEGYVYSDLVPTYFNIDKNYYKSNEFLGDINQLKSLVERYLNMLDKLDESYRLLKIYSEEELN
tara:strand:- start:5197 stop:5919 length:723 start_codon:yes stop_codon:yes gene_type:complete